MSTLLRLVTSDCPFGIFKLYLLSFNRTIRINNIHYMWKVKQYNFEDKCVRLCPIRIFSLEIYELCCLTPLSTIFVISWRSVLLMKETRVPGENKWPNARHWQTLKHKVAWVYLDLRRIRTRKFSGDRHWLNRYL